MNHQVMNIWTKQRAGQLQWFMDHHLAITSSWSRNQAEERGECGTEKLGRHTGGTEREHRGAENNSNTKET